MFEKPNGAYMVLEIGGGTVDITAQVISTFISSICKAIIK